MIIFRYLAKEVLLTLLALTSILMLIFMSNQLVQYLNRAAMGSIPGVVIIQLMLLEMPNLLGLLLPLGFYMAIMLAYGRLYADSEMTVLRASGYGTAMLVKDSLIMASGIALVTAVMVLWLGPYISTERSKLLTSAGIKTLIQTIMPGRFHAISGGNQVFYVQSMSRDHTKAEQIFLAKKKEVNGKEQWDVLWADKAFSEENPRANEDYVILQNGREYQGIPGKADYQVTHFSEYKAKIPHTIVDVKDDIRTVKTSALFPLNHDKKKTSELQWRLSIPMMVFVLTFVAVPLSRVNPRTGKFAKLFPAILVYIIYANFMFVARNALTAGKIPLWVGMWWVHALCFALGAFLLWRERMVSK